MHTAGDVLINWACDNSVIQKAIGLVLGSEVVSPDPHEKRGGAPPGNTAPSHGGGKKILWAIE